MDKVGTSNINVHETGNILNSAGGSVNIYQPLTFFTAAAKINKWAKGKPESKKQDTALSDYERSQNNFGFDINSITAVTPTLFSKGSSAWAYILPKGGADSPYRLGDFRGYNPDAKPPFSYDKIMKSDTTTSSGTYTNTWRVERRSDSELKMSDFSIFSDMNSKNYLFVARKKVDTNNYIYVKSSLVSMGNDPSTIDCSITFPSPGEWECMFCMGQNISTEIQARTDLVVMPEGYFKVNLSKVAVYAQITYSYPNLGDCLYNKDEKSWYSGGYFYLNVKAKDANAPVSSTKFKFGFEVQLLDSNGSLLDSRTIYSPEDNDLFTYSGTDEKTWQIIDFPNPLYLTNYFDEDRINNASTLRMTVDVVTVEGSGLVSMNYTSYDYSMK